LLGLELLGLELLGLELLGLELLGLDLLLLLKVRLPPLGSLSYPLVALGDLEHSPPGFGIDNLISHGSRPAARLRQCFGSFEIACGTASPHEAGP
jgi:hypothetical protein